MMSIVNFDDKLREENVVLKRKKLSTLQVNLGKLCNLACQHCHVEAGPLRQEMMNEKTALRLMELIKKADLDNTIFSFDPKVKDLINKIATKFYIELN
jgi:MoaA/NifB/PqqE/SkfB family radical SAM enzyme